MNGAYLHLAINHIPVIGVPFAFFLLLAGLIKRSRDLVQAGFVTLIIMGLGAYPMVKTGRMAAHVLFSVPGTGVVPAAIHEHAEAADFGYWGAIGMGVLSLVGFFVMKKNQEFPKTWVVIVLVGSLWLSTVMLRVAHLGGLIRHPEIEQVASAPK